MDYLTDSIIITQALCRLKKTNNPCPKGAQCRTLEKPNNFVGYYIDIK